MPEGALATAKRIASLSPIAVVGTKKALVHARDHTVQQGLDYMQLLNGSMLQSKDLADSITAAMSKQRPKFAKL